jgi:ketosteroid isomerase-like protein
MTHAPETVVRAVADGVSRLITGVGDREEVLDQLAGLYAETTDVRHPFAPLGDTPLRSRAELRTHFAAVAVDPDVERFEPVERRLLHTADPEVVVYEFDYVGVVGGRSFSVPCVFVVRVRDGVIVESRDYTDHIGFARTFGRLGQLVKALAADQAA